MPSNKKKLSHQDKIQYIKGLGEKQWLPHPDDPYIYISFSKLQFDIFHQLFDTSSLHQHGIRRINSAIENKIKAIIQEQLFDRTNLPIKFLDENLVEPLDITTKNICFILSTDLTYQDYIKKYNSLDVHTDTFSIYQHFLKQHGAISKIMRIPKIEYIEDWNNMMTYNLLHELAHAIWEGKHPVKYQDNDVGPFLTELDCTDTVLTYLQHCKPVLDNLTPHFKGKGFDLKNFTPEDRMIANEAFNHFPTEYGQLDLAAIQDFVKSWKHRNQLAKEIIAKRWTEIEEGRWHQELIQYRDIYKEYNDIMPNDFLGWIMHSIKNIVDSCPSYFPENNLNYWSRNNQSLLFSSNGNNQTNTTELLTNGMLSLSL